MRIKMLYDIKTKIKSINFNRLKDKSLVNLSNLALQVLRLQVNMINPMLNLILRARGIDTKIDPRKIAFHKMKIDMLWCLDHPSRDPDVSVKVNETGKLADVYVEPKLHIKPPQSSGTTLFSGPEAIKKVREFIIENNKKRAETKVEIKNIGNNSIDDLRTVISAVEIENLPRKTTKNNKAKLNRKSKLNRKTK